VEQAEIDLGVDQIDELQSDLFAQNAQRRLLGEKSQLDRCLIEPHPLGLRVAGQLGCRSSRSPCGGAISPTSIRCPRRNGKDFLWVRSRILRSRALRADCKLSL